MNATFNNCDVVIPDPGFIAEIYVVLTVAPGGAATRTFTVYKNGVAATPAVTLTGAATTGSNTTPVAVTTFDTIAVFHTTTVGPSNSVGKVTIVYTN